MVQPQVAINSSNIMKYYLQFVITAILLTGMILLHTADANTPEQASALVKSTTDRMLQLLEQRKEEIKTNPDIIYDLAEKVAVPHFDFELITQYAMGRFWRQANTIQRKTLVAEFRTLLIRTYAKALLYYSGQKIRLFPPRLSNRADRVQVQTEVDMPGGAPVPISYQMYLRKGKWVVYDVIINGISLVTNYRSSFAQEVFKGGIQGLINTLKARNQKGAS